MTYREESSVPWASAAAAIRPAQSQAANPADGGMGIYGINHQSSVASAPESPINAIVETSVMAWFYLYAGFDSSEEDRFERHS